MYVYLASPYTAPAYDLMEARYHLTVKATAEIASAKIPVYSPIVSWHEVARQCKLPTDADFWWQQDRALIRHCCELWVLTLPGYERSNGVKMEVAFASALHLPIRYGINMEPLIREFKLNHPTIAGAPNG
jgi:hypothetical protein